MQGDSLHAVEGLSAYSSRVRVLQTSATRLKAVRDEISADLESKSAEIQRLEEQNDVLGKVSELYRVLMDKLVLTQVQALESLVTEGLKSIFFDQDLSFRAELGTKYNRVNIDLFFCQGDPDNGGFKGDPLNSFGGGPSSLASLVLRVMTLLRMKRRRVLLLDESLGGISDEYIDLTGQFLQRLAETSSLDILLVTHKSSFLEHANRAYLGEQVQTDKRKELVVRKLPKATK